MDKAFTVAGVSTLKGEVKARFANDMARVKVLAANGHKDIRLVQLPKAMNKADAVAYLASNAQFQDAAAQAAIKEVGAAKPAAAKAPKAAKVDVDAIRAKNLETIQKTASKLKKMEERSGETVEG